MNHHAQPLSDAEIEGQLQRLDMLRGWSLQTFIAYRTDLMQWLKARTDHGAELRALQRLLGHCSISTIKIFTHVTHVSRVRLHEFVNQAHPMGERS